MIPAEEEMVVALDPSPSVWEREGRALLVAAFKAATSDASVAAGQATSELAPRVHEFRKALRRAGAVLALARRALSRDEYKAIRDQLRIARRAVSAARDHTVAADALATLPFEPEVREVANQLVVTLHEHEPNSGELAAQMVDGAQRARAQVTALEAALPDHVEWRAIARGVAGMYRSASRARREAKRSARSFHRWRRRAKELAAQLTLLAAHAGERTQALRLQYTEISDQLGPIADLLMLREFIEAHGAAWAPERFESLSTSIEQLGDVEVRRARKHGKALFTRKAKDLTKKLTKAIRKDAIPPTLRSEDDLAAPSGEAAPAPAATSDDAPSV